MTLYDKMSTKFVDNTSVHIFNHQGIIWYPSLISRQDSTDPFYPLVSAHRWFDTTTGQISSTRKFIMYPSLCQIWQHVNPSDLEQLWSKYKAITGQLLYGPLLNLIILYCSLRCFMVLCGSMSYFMVFYGTSWYFMVLYGTLLNYKLLQKNIRYDRLLHLYIIDRVAYVCGSVTKFWG